MKQKKGRTIVRTSRKSYILFYTMAITVLLALLYIWINNLYIHPYALAAALIFVILIFKVTEVHRLSHHYELREHGLEKVEGLIWKKHKHLGYGSISQLHLIQSPLDTILGIGSVEIGQFSETIRTEIKNINKPKRFMKEVFQLQRKVAE